MRLSQSMMVKVVAGYAITLGLVSFALQQAL